MKRKTVLGGWPMLIVIPLIGLVIALLMSTQRSEAPIASAATPSPQNPYCNGVGALPCYTSHYTSLQELRESVDAELRTVGYGNAGRGSVGSYTLGACVYRSYLSEPTTIALGETITCSVTGTSPLLHLRIAVTVTKITVLPFDVNGETLVSYAYRIVG